tara:strand:+ start:260 stop:829 length:570 start_codon:yes stop_codon:yes gene_type:complete
MVRAKKEYQYVEIWSGKVSERVSARISRMIDPPKEREYYINESYLKKAESPKDYETESNERLKFKHDSEKYYINAQVQGFDGNPFLTKGFSITRKDIPKMIDALQKIVGGEFDLQIKHVLLESGIIKDIEESVKEVRSEEKEEQEAKEEEFRKFYDNLSEDEKNEVKKMKKSGWIEKDIMTAFQFQREK